MVGLISLGIALLILTGCICGIVAVIRLKRLDSVLAQVNLDVARLRAEVSRIKERMPDESPPQSLPVWPKSDERKTPTVDRPLAVKAPASPPLEPARPTPATPAAAPEPFSHPRQEAASALSLEMHVGTRWIIWLGTVIFLGGVALALKYSYDNNLVGPAGRLMTGMATGLAALVAGEYYYRRRLTIPFQAFTGGGLAILYLCIFFAFQVYHLTGAGVSMVLAVGVTGLAIFLSVFHNAMPIALLAVAGGFMSPIFLSTGQNAPWTLFTYIALLNLVALGAAFFRRWRALDLFCLVCTATLYQLWYINHYRYPDQIAPALTFATLFYLMFMAAPMAYGLIRRIPEGLNSLTLLVGNSLFWLFCYYTILFENYRHTLGFVVLGQAALTFGLYLLWMRQVRQATPTAQSLLVVALALLTLVVPLQLHYYAIPIAWAVQGTLFFWLSYRFKNLLCRLGAATALALAVGALIEQLPLHTLPFMPVFNGSFGAWLFVALCLVVSAMVVHRCRNAEDRTEAFLASGLAIAALALTCWLLTMETFLYWRLDNREGWFASMSDSMITLWTIIPLLLTAVAWRRQKAELVVLAQGAYIVAILMFLYSLTGLNSRDEWLLLNLYVGPRLLFILALWKSVSLFSQIPQDTDGLLQSFDWYRPGRMDRALELAGHAALALLCFAELVRWGRATVLVSADMAVGVISAVWALHACLLIWHGLVSRRQFRRYAGFLLFALATGKTVFLDTFNLEAAHRIVSWLGIGMLLVIAALLYQRYSALLLAEDAKEYGDERDSSTPTRP